ncbi:MAG: peptidoglycan DD-metalloendopeptidase family protein, partial [Rickettsiales bacterium]|nr:peptidoglycan DD-metalloendopeptidase family protein [Rickettsiales bacterium]
KEHDNSYTPQIIEDETVTKFMRAKGTIQSSVYMAAKSSALPEKLILDFICIYSHSIDFQRDIKQGDQFEVLYERQFTIDGKDTNEMSIVFASLTTNGKQREVYRYRDEVTDRYEYYDETGHSIKRGLLRTPINGARLSSGFGMRKHPILGYSKMHKGVDFAAPRGTPIFAAGDGIVTAAKTYGSYGRYIKIRHYNSYSTAYAHLHRFARNIKKGKRVKQGQVIGYVGSTGRSTGNHLHYEVHRNGKHINPKKIVLPARSQLKGVELARFQVYSNSVQELVSNIPAITNTNVASLNIRSRSSVH